MEPAKRYKPAGRGKSRFLPTGAGSARDRRAKAPPHPLRRRFPIAISQPSA